MCRFPNTEQQDQFHSAKNIQNRNLQHYWVWVFHVDIKWYQRSKCEILEPHLPSWELTYPHPRHFWRWFSFYQGGICWFPGTVILNHDPGANEHLPHDRKGWTEQRPLQCIGTLCVIVGVHGCREWKLKKKRRKQWKGKIRCNWYCTGR